MLFVCLYHHSPTQLILVFVHCATTGNIIGTLFCLHQTSSPGSDFPFALALSFPRRSRIGPKEGRRRGQISEPKRKIMAPGPSPRPLPQAPPPSPQHPHRLPRDRAQSPSSSLPQPSLPSPSSSPQRRATANGRTTSTRLEPVLEGDPRLLVDVQQQQRPAPLLLSNDQVRRRGSSPGLGRQRSKYFEQAFGSPRDVPEQEDKVRGQAIVLADLKTNVVVSSSHHSFFIPQKRITDH